MLDTILEILGILSRNKLRTSATGFAVTSGIFLLIVLLGAGNGIIHTLEHNAGDLSLDVVGIYGGYASMPYQGLTDGRWVQLDTRDEALAETYLPEYVTEASAEIYQGGIVATVGANYVTGVELTGCYPISQQIHNLKLKYGRFVNSFDLKERRKVVVMGEEEVEKLFKTTGDVTGRWVNINDIAFQIVGVIKKAETGAWRTALHAPFTTVQTIFGRGRNIDELVLRSTGLEDTTAARHFRERIYRVLGNAHSFDPEDRRALWINNSAESAENVNSAKIIINRAFWILGLLTLLSGVAGVSNIMLISVKERTHDFGIRKALGAKPRNIIWMVLAESIIITTIFGYIGMVAGVAFCQYMDAASGNQVLEESFVRMQYFIDPTVDLGTCIQATVVMIMAGAVAGFIPARKAAHVSPIEALRSE